MSLFTSLFLFFSVHFHPFKGWRISNLVQYIPLCEDEVRTQPAEDNSRDVDDNTGSKPQPAESQSDDDTKKQQLSSDDASTEPESENNAAAEATTATAEARWKSRQKYRDRKRERGKMKVRERNRQTEREREIFSMLGLLHTNEKICLIQNFFYLDSRLSRQTKYTMFQGDIFCKII